MTDFPNTRGKLIGRFVDECLTKEIQHREKAHSIAEGKSAEHRKMVNEVLIGIASMIQEKKLGTGILHNEIFPKLSENWAEDQILQSISIAKEAGVLERNSIEEGQIKFFHHLFQEYFACLALKNAIFKKPNENVQQFLNNKLWWEPQGWEESVILLSEIIDNELLDNLVIWISSAHPLLTIRCVERVKNSNRYTLSEMTMNTVRSIWYDRINKEKSNMLNVPSIIKIGEALSIIGDNRKGIRTQYEISKNLFIPDIEWIEVSDANLFVARYPITVEQFNLFINDSGYDFSKSHWHDIDGIFYWKDKIERKIDYFNMNKPVIGVTWFEAVAFCNWLSNISNQEISLPNEKEWLCIYDHFIHGVSNDYFVNYKRDRGCDQLVSCGIFSDPHTPIIDDLIGNCWEWCADVLTHNVDDLFLDDYKTSEHIPLRIAKGGSWRYSEGFTKPEYRLFTFADYSDKIDNHKNDIGFRIIKHFKEGIL